MATMQNTSGVSERSEYAKKLEEQLARWKKEIAGVRDHAKEVTARMTGEASAEVKAAFEALKAREQDMEERLATLKTATDEAWETMKVGMEMAWVDLETAGKEAAARFESVTSPTHPG